MKNFVNTFFLLLGLYGVCQAGAVTHAVEEHLRGTLEHTAKVGACAQMTDALKETYYVLNTPEAQKACADLFGKKALLTGVVEQRVGDQDYYIKLIKLEPWEPTAPGGTLPRPAPVAPDNAPPIPLTPPPAEPLPAPVPAPASVDPKP